MFWTLNILCSCSVFKLTALICSLRVYPNFDSRPKDWIFLGCLSISEESLGYAESNFFLGLLTHHKSLFFTWTAYNAFRWENVCYSVRMKTCCTFRFTPLWLKKSTRVSNKYTSRYCREDYSAPTVTCILVTFISNLGKSADCTEWDCFWYSTVCKFMLSKGISNYVMISFHVISDLLSTDHLKH